MSIKHYLGIIGRGQHGARALPREQVADLFGQVLDGRASDLEIGAFCVAMRFKGITPDEMMGFLDATQARLAHLPRSPATQRPLVVLPSYNGARKLPVLTPLLALLLARAGLPVLLHGCQTETGRVTSQAVLAALGIPALDAPRLTQPIADGELVHADTALLCPGIKRLLDTRQTIGLRNPAHSVVKLMQPGSGAQLIVSSYTHTGYASLMTETFARLQARPPCPRPLSGKWPTSRRWRGSWHDGWQGLFNIALSLAPIRNNARRTRSACPAPSAF